MFFFSLLLLLTACDNGVAGDGRGRPPSSSNFSCECEFIAFACIFSLVFMPKIRLQLGMCLRNRHWGSFWRSPGS